MRLGGGGRGGAARLLVGVGALEAHVGNRSSSGGQSIISLSSLSMSLSSEN